MRLFEQLFVMDTRKQTSGSVHRVYRHRRDWQRSGRKLPRQYNSPMWVRKWPRGRFRDCQRQGLLGFVGPRVAGRCCAVAVQALVSNSSSVNAPAAQRGVPSAASATRIAGAADFGGRGSEVEPSLSARVGRLLPCRFCGRIDHHCNCRR